MPVLDWIGKQAVVNHHLEVPYRLLQGEAELSVGEAGSGNLLVEGDNLEALKALLPYYAGQVKCIYIDPPYNTGNEKWVYNDNVNSPEMRRWLGERVKGAAEDLCREDKWLCMMYPRLVLLRDFLTEDGSLWVSIDDASVDLLRCILDEILGRQRFVACNVWQKRYSRENREAIGDVHEYIVVYAMDPARFKAVRHLVSMGEDKAKVYRNPNNDPRGRWRPVPISAQAGHATPEQFYEIATPSGRVFRPSQGRCWSLSRATFERLRAEGRIYFGKKGDSQPSLIRYLDEVEGVVPWTWWPHEEVGHTDEATKELLALFPEGCAFDTTPKPTRLLKRILQIATDGDSLVLDSFAGSGTTGHAVMSLNEEDGGDRRFVLVELDARIARDVTKERLRRVGERLAVEDGSAVPPGFRYCTLGATLFDERGRTNPEVRFPDLARHVFFTETREPLLGDVAGDSPLIGVNGGVAYYLLYNGVLKDRRVNGGNILTGPLLESLPAHDGPKVIYGLGCRLGAERLRQANVTFKQIPYQVKGG